MRRHAIIFCYPPGPLYQRGEDRCQFAIESSSATSMRPANDLGYGAAIVRQQNCEALIRDWQTEGVSRADALDEIARCKPAMIVMTVTNASIEDDLAFVRSIRERLDYRCTIVLRGAIFWDPPRQMFEEADFFDADYLVGGEVELSIEALVNVALYKKGAITAIPNIFYKGADGVFVPTYFSTWHENLDEIPFPARDLMSNQLYVRPDTGAPLATIQTSRGCCATCSFCLSPLIAGTRIRQRSAHNVLAEIEECYFVHGIKDFFFRADTFTMDARWVEELCTLIRTSEVAGKINFVANSRVKPLDRETLALLKSAGCYLIAFGYESGSDETLRRIGKGATTEDNRRAARWAKEVGLEVFGFFMAGFPWEDASHLGLTRQHLLELAPEFCEVHIAFPYQGTRLYRQCQDEGLLVPQSLGKDFFSSSIVGTLHLSRDELIRWRMHTLRAYYLRPRYIAARIGDIIGNPQTFKNYWRYGTRLMKNLSHV